MGDKGYIGENLILTPSRVALLISLSPSTPGINLRTTIECIENAIGRITKYHILKIPFRSGTSLEERMSLHAVVMNVCCQLAALDLDRHPIRAEEPNDI